MDNYKRTAEFEVVEKGTICYEDSLRIRLSNEFKKNYEQIKKNNPIFRLRGNLNETIYLRNISLDI